VTPRQTQEAAGPREGDPKRDASRLGTQSAGGDSEVDARLLLQRAINDKKADAFALLYARYYPRLVHYMATRTGAAPEAEDWAQDVFVQLWGTHARYEIGSSAEAYLFTVANQVIAWHLRQKRQRYRLVANRALDGAGVHSLPADPDRTDWISALLSHGSVENPGIKLSPKSCEALRLRFVQGLSMAEAARTAGCSVAALYSRLERGLRSLRQAVRENP
jgi:RNA polymerase sigma-70 factor (ECF subfamily)